jgi:hypothetical protein
MVCLDPAEYPFPLFEFDPFHELHVPLTAFAALRAIEHEHPPLLISDVFPISALRSVVGASDHKGSP